MAASFRFLAAGLCVAAVVALLCNQDRCGSWEEMQ